jgi:hypothetical protein
VELGEKRMVEALEGFSMRSILMWFEAMSLIGSVYGAVTSIEEARRWAVSGFTIGHRIGSSFESDSDDR